MSRPNKNSLLAIAGASPFNALAGTPLLDVLEARAPGFRDLHRFFKRWLKIDITTLAYVLTLFGAITSGISIIRDIGARLWTYTARFFVSTISISGQDTLNEVVLNWVIRHVLPRRQPRILAAQSEESATSLYAYRAFAIKDDTDEVQDKPSLPISYIPAFGRIWFIHDGNVFILQRIPAGGPKANDDYFKKAPNGHEDLVVMCLGRSPEPIQRFFTTCRDDLDDLNKRHVVVRETGRTKETIFWKTPVYHRMRPLETVHFDSAVKNDLVADIASYNSQECRTYYKTRGIPYRRGYLLHGPPGTGKTSLCVALASHFHVSLYIMHLPSIANDSVLSEFFKYLPEKCFVVLEDIDAVGLDHRTANPGNSPKDICTLSGLLNVLDGVASSEGRIILMTTNFIDRLDAALLRPGRIDKKIYLGKLERPAAKEMFLRMYKSDKHIEGTASSREIGDLDLMAEEFSRKLPEHTLTPAQLQGYLLANRKTPEVVVAGIQEWAEHELEDARKKREEYEAIVNAEARGQGAVRPQVIQSQEPPSAAQSSETANNATEIDVKERKDEQPNGQVNEQDEKTAETKEDGKTTDQKDEGSSGQDVVNTPESPTSSDSDYHSVGDNTEEAKPSDSKPTETTAA